MLRPTNAGAVITCDHADCGAVVEITSDDYAWDARRIGWAEQEQRWACPEHRKRLPAIVAATSRRISAPAAGSDPGGL